MPFAHTLPTILCQLIFIKKLLQIFAHYELLDHYGNRVSEGQKASFCLEDNDCNDGVRAVYDCENYGDQGITPGCKVIKKI